MRIPPGRAGRRWLQQRIEVAHRGADVLEQKRQVLLRERERTERLLAEATEMWIELGRVGSEWNDRVLALAGARRLRLAALQGGERATLSVGWRNAFGARIPAGERVEYARGSGRDAASGGPGIALATRAHRDALTAAAAMAAAHAAHEAVAAELAATTRRLRAIERRWIPRHEALLHQLEIALAERELEDVVRSRHALERRSATGSRGI